MPSGSAALSFARESTEINALRDSKKADLVSYWTDITDSCGMGHVTSTAMYGFSAVDVECATGYYSFGHEIGHNFGCSHNHDSTQSCGGCCGCYDKTSYTSYGYIIEAGKYRTVMSYSKGGERRINQYSNPAKTYNGVAAGDANANCAKTINERALAIANFRASQDTSTSTSTSGSTTTTSTACVGSWSSWSGCSATCGGGQKTRKYTVTTAGSNCEAADGATQAEECNDQACPTTTTSSSSASTVLWGEACKGVQGSCGNCLTKDNCKEGLFCCPSMKKCVSSGTSCYTPTARCSGCYDSTYKNTPSQCSCQNSAFPSTWVSCTKGDVDAAAAGSSSSSSGTTTSSSTTSSTSSSSTPATTTSSTSCAWLKDSGENYKVKCGDGTIQDAVNWAIRQWDWNGCDGRGGIVNCPPGREMCERKTCGSNGDSHCCSSSCSTYGYGAARACTSESTTPATTSTTSSTTSSSTTSSSSFSWTTAQRDEFLKAHNKYRCMHGVSAVTWSTEVAAAAQKWADTLQARGSIGHDNDQSTGENLYMSWSSSSTAVPSPAACTKSWYDEVKDYDFNAPKFSSATGHFTAVVWKGTTEIGCGYAPVKTSSGTTWRTIVCRYKSAGNIGGQFATNVLPLTSESNIQTCTTKYSQVDGASRFQDEDIMETPATTEMETAQPEFPADNTFLVVGVSMMVCAVVVGAVVYRRRRQTSWEPADYLVAEL
eukprot:NODE_147_length_3150_cov_118.375289_g137_i0.p1 GENE.NODE_147_length_3150_cov_118.375289_g137_i0~~NODE_147_length_3150_cov_118.375289_g137_i0.p1  ORF type:complete len:714 (+),score=204.53 NODE_147_length_3150_cov_118.375289_g137_i0:753-2894(+)